MILLITGMLLKVREREILLILQQINTEITSPFANAGYKTLKRWSSKIIID
jgi:hypothetical protein